MIEEAYLSMTPEQRQYADKEFRNGIETGIILSAITAFIAVYLYTIL